MTSSNVLLVAPKASMGDRYQPSLGLYYLKSYIEYKKNIKVNIFDLNLTSVENLMDFVSTTKPNIVGISTFSPNRFSSLDMALEIKTKLPSCNLVFGGFHASFLYEQILKNYPFVDMVIRGEGEETLLDLINHFEANEDMTDVKGLAFRNKDALIINPMRDSIENLDSIPFPEYVEYWMPYNGRSYKAASIITSRGCFGGCKFCAAPAFWKKSRFRSDKNVVDEILNLVKKYEVQYINFIDDTFTDSSARVNNICDLINQLKLKIIWRATARINTLNYDLIKKMKESGCVELSVGIESGSQNILNSLGKRTAVEKIEEICSIIKKMKINLSACFIVGTPGESKTTIEETKAIIKKIRPDEFNVSQALYLFPGTSFARKFSKKGIYNDNLWLDRNIGSIKYLAEQEESELVRWQMELIKTAFKMQSFRKKIRYVLEILKWIKFSQIFKIILSLLPRK